MKKIEEQKLAVVIGGSVSGLCAAAAVAPFFEKVQILEKDSADFMSNRRFGVPQEPHAHGILEGGRAAMEHLLPGFSELLLKNGARIYDFTFDMKFFTGGYWMKRHKGYLAAYVQRRSLVDLSLIEMIAKQYKNVELFYGKRILSIQPNSVRLENEELRPNLIIDASGKMSPFIKPFINYSRVTTIDLMYSTLEFDVPEIVGDLMGIYMLPTEKCKRGCAVIRLAGDRVLATASGYAEGKPDKLTDVDSWLNFMKGLEQPDAYNFLTQGKAVWKKPKNFGYKTMQHHSLKDVPLGLIFIGDAKCSIDPIYGQGMSKAAIEAESIRKALELKGYVTQKDISGVALSAFTLSCVAEYQMTHTSGYAPPGAKILAQALQYIFKSASRNEVVYDAFLRIMNLQSHPLTLFLYLPKIFRSAFFKNITKELNQTINMKKSSIDDEPYVANHARK